MEFDAATFGKSAIGDTFNLTVAFCVDLEKFQITFATKETSASGNASKLLAKEIVLNGRMVLMRWVLN